MTLQPPYWCFNSENLSGAVKWPPLCGLCYHGSAKMRADRQSQHLTFVYFLLTFVYFLLVKVKRPHVFTIDFKFLTNFHRELVS